MITMRHGSRLLALGALLGLLAVGLVGCGDSKRAELEHPTFKTPPPQPKGPPIGPSAGSQISGGQTSPAGTQGNTHF